METHLSWKFPQPGQEKPKRLSMALNFSASPLKSKKDLNTKSASLTSNQTSDRPSFHKLDQRAQAAKSLSSVKLPMSGISL